jgi:hypothetical protein
MIARFSASTTGGWAGLFLQGLVTLEGRVPLKSLEGPVPPGPSNGVLEPWDGVEPVPPKGTVEGGVEPFPSVELLI